ncbi:MAG: Holliday junction resolvase RuvX [Deltaproteobacteria bacterium]|nr:Holliday junction resolvase RuvX [Deltaproteobacteria bacterium]
MRALGLDVGSKTIGVAITDEAEIAAHPLTVLARTGMVGDSAAIAALTTEYGITAIVIGMPFELSGKVGHRARRVLELMTALRSVIGDRVTWHEQDERFTTAEAQRVLIAADVSRAKRKRVIDQQAAALILQTWLDGWKRSQAAAAVNGQKPE